MESRPFPKRRVATKKKAAHRAALLANYYRSPAISHRSRLSGLGDELERHPVVAPALAGRLRAVIEHMPVVAAAALAVVLGARQEQVVVGLGLEYPRYRREEARPAGAAFVLHRRGEERQVAPGAGEHALALLVVERARPRALRALLAQHRIGRRRETLAPFILRKLQRLGGKRRLVAFRHVDPPVLLQFGYALHVLHLGLGGPAPSRQRVPQARDQHALQQIPSRHGISSIELPDN